MKGVGSERHATENAREFHEPVALASARVTGWRRSSREIGQRQDVPRAAHGTRGPRHAMSRRSLRIPSSLNDPRGLVQSRPLPPQFAHGSADASPAQSGQGDAA
jgi:hypothetical protein